MEWLIGCGCLGGLLAVPLAIWIAAATGRQHAKLRRVNIDLLTEGERVMWQAFDSQLDKGHALKPEEMGNYILDTTN